MTVNRETRENTCFLSYFNKTGTVAETRCLRSVAVLEEKTEDTCNTCVVSWEKRKSELQDCVERRKW